MSETMSVTLVGRVQGGAEISRLKNDLVAIERVRVDVAQYEAMTNRIRSAANEVQRLKDNWQKLVSARVNLNLDVSTSDIQRKLHALNLSVKLRVEIDQSGLSSELSRLWRTFQATGSTLKALVKVDASALERINEELKKRIAALQALGSSGTIRNQVSDPRMSEIRALNGDYQAGTLAMGQYRAQLQAMLGTINTEMGMLRSLGVLTEAQSQKLNNLRAQAGSVTQAIQRLNNDALSKMRAELSGARASFDAASTAATTMAQKRAAVQAYTAEITRLQLQMAALKNTGQLTTQQLTQLNNMMGQATRTMNSINGGVNVGGLSGNIRNALNGMSLFIPQAGMAASVLGSLDVKAVAAGLAIGALALAVLGAGAAVLNTVQTFGKFQKESQNLKAVTQGTTGEMAALNAQAKNLGAALDYGAVGIAQFTTMQAELAKAGISTRDILAGGAENVALLATATRIEIPQAVEIASAAMTMFGLSGKDMARVTDTIVAGANKSALEVNTLGQSLQQAGNMAAGAKMTLEQTIAFLALLADRGIKGSDAGTLLKTMIMRLTGELSEVVPYLEKYNIQVYDSTGKQRDMFAILGDIVKVMSTLSDEERQNWMVKVGGSDAMRGLVAAYKAGTSELGNYMKKVQDAGIALATAKTQMDNIIDKQNALSKKWELFKTNFGEFAAPALDSVLNKAINFLDRLNASMQGQDSGMNSWLKNAGLQSTDADASERARIKVFWERIPELQANILTMQSKLNTPNIMTGKLPSGPAADSWRKQLEADQKELASLVREAGELQKRLTFRKQGLSTSGEAVSNNKITEAVVEEIARQTKTNPAIQSHCAEVAAAMVQQMGLSIKTSNNAKQLLQNAYAAGGQKIDPKLAQPGDLIFYRGPNYGLQKYQEGKGQKVGYHVEVVESNVGGKLTSAGSDGSAKVHTDRAVTDLANALVIRLPQVLKPDNVKAVPKGVEDLMPEARRLLGVVETLRSTSGVATKEFRDASQAVDAFSKSSDFAAKAISFAQTEISSQTGILAKTNKAALEALKDSIQNASGQRLRARRAEAVKLGQSDIVDAIDDEFRRRAKVEAEKRSKLLGEIQKINQDAARKALVQQMNPQQTEVALKQVASQITSAKSLSQLNELQAKQNELLAHRNELQEGFGSRIQSLKDRLEKGIISDSDFIAGAQKIGGELQKALSFAPKNSDYHRGMKSMLDGLNGDVRKLNDELQKAGLALQEKRYSLTPALVAYSYGQGQAGLGNAIKGLTGRDFSSDLLAGMKELERVSPDMARVVSEAYAQVIVGLQQAAEQAPKIAEVSAQNSLVAAQQAYDQAVAAAHGNAETLLAVEKNQGAALAAVKRQQAEQNFTVLKGELDKRYAELLKTTLDEKTLWEQYDVELRALTLQRNGAVSQIDREHHDALLSAQTAALQFQQQLSETSAQTAVLTAQQAYDEQLALAEENKALLLQVESQYGLALTDALKRQEQARFLSQKAELDAQLQTGALGQQAYTTKLLAITVDRDSKLAAHDRVARDRLKSAQDSFSDWQTQQAKAVAAQLLQIQIDQASEVLKALEHARDVALSDESLTADARYTLAQNHGMKILAGQRRVLALQKQADQDEETRRYQSEKSSLEKQGATAAQIEDLKTVHLGKLANLDERYRNLDLTSEKAYHDSLKAAFRDVVSEFTRASQDRRDALLKGFKDLNDGATRGAALSALRDLLSELAKQGDKAKDSIKAVQTAIDGLVDGNADPLGAWLKIYRGTVTTVDGKPQLANQETLNRDLNRVGTPEDADSAFDKAFASFDPLLQQQKTLRQNTVDAFAAMTVPGENATPEEKTTYAERKKEYELMLSLIDGFIAQITQRATTAGNKAREVFLQQQADVAQQNKVTTAEIQHGIGLMTDADYLEVLKGDQAYWQKRMDVLEKAGPEMADAYTDAMKNFQSARDRVDREVQDQQDQSDKRHSDRTALAESLLAIGEISPEDYLQVLKNEKAYWDKRAEILKAGGEKTATEYAAAAQKIGDLQSKIISTQQDIDQMPVLGDRTALDAAQDEIDNQTLLDDLATLKSSYEGSTDLEGFMRDLKDLEALAREGSSAWREIQSAIGDVQAQIMKPEHQEALAGHTLDLLLGKDVDFSEQSVEELRAAWNALVTKSLGGTKIGQALQKALQDAISEQDDGEAANDLTAKFWKRFDEVFTRDRDGFLLPNLTDPAQIEDFIAEMDGIIAKLKELGIPVEDLTQRWEKYKKTLGRVSEAKATFKPVLDIEKQLSQAGSFSARGDFEDQLQAMRELRADTEAYNKLLPEQKDRLNALIPVLEQLNEKSRVWNNIQKWAGAAAEVLRSLGSAFPKTDLGNQLTLLGDAVNTGLGIAEKVTKGDYAGAIVQGASYLIGGFTSAQNSYNEHLKNVESANKKLRFTNANSYTTAKYNAGLFGSSFGATYSTEVDEFAQDVSQTFEQQIASGISDAFDQVLQSGSFANFAKTLETSVGKAALSALQQAFMSARLQPYIDAYAAALKTPDKADDLLAAQQLRGAVPGLVQDANQFVNEVYLPVANEFGLAGQGGASGVPSGTVITSSLPGMGVYAESTQGLQLMQDHLKELKVIRNVLEAGVILTELQAINRNTLRTAEGVERLLEQASTRPSSSVAR